jgi:serine/threonine protein kinase
MKTVVKVSERMTSFSYEQGRLIASGTYGSVYEALQISEQDARGHLDSARPDGFVQEKTVRQVAVKMMPLLYEAGQMETDGVNHSFVREVNALLRIGKHANIVSMLEYAIKDQRAAIVLEKMRCDLLHILQTHSGSLTPHNCASLVVQLCTAVERCHAVGIMHRDIKPQNILIYYTDSGDNEDKKQQAEQNFTLKLADFGQSRPFRAHGRAWSTPMTTTLWYCSPEQLVGGQNYGAPNDIWSAGCVVFHLITRSDAPPFCGDSALDMLISIFSNCGYFDDATLEKYADEWKGLSMFHESRALFDARRLREIINGRVCNALLPFAAPMYRMLFLDPARRPTAGDALAQMRAIVVCE